MGKLWFYQSYFIHTETSFFFNKPACIDLGFVTKRKIKQVQKPSWFNSFTAQYLIRKVRQVLEQYQSLYHAPCCACTHTNTDVQEHLYSLQIPSLQLLVISLRLLWHLKSSSYASCTADLTCLRQKKIAFCGCDRSVEVFMEIDVMRGDKKDQWGSEWRCGFAGSFRDLKGDLGVRPRSYHENLKSSEWFQEVISWTKLPFTLLLLS